jgi:hypothetical protein
MAEETPIEDLVRADHEAANEKFTELETLAAQFKRGDTVYCARIEKTQVTVRYGIINRIKYANKEILFNIAPSETGNADFTISTRNWDIFESEQQMYDYIHTAISNEDAEPDTEGETTEQG